MWTISTLQPGKMGLPPTASLPLSQNKFSHKNKKIDILRIEWVCVWKAEIRKIIIPVKPADTPPALCIMELRHVHRRRECSFASRAQPVPPVAPCNPSTPSSPLSISCIPAWGPNAGCHPSLSPPSLSSSPTATLPPPPHSHPGGGSSCALHSSERSRLALRGALGFTNCVRPRDTSVINTDRHMRGEIITQALPRDRSDWCCQYVKSGINQPSYLIQTVDVCVTGRLEVKSQEDGSHSHCFSPCTSRTHMLCFAVKLRNSNQKSHRNALLVKILESEGNNVHTAGGDYR